VGGGVGWGYGGDCVRDVGNREREFGEFEWESFGWDGDAGLDLLEGMWGIGSTNDVGGGVIIFGWVLGITRLC